MLCHATVEVIWKGGMSSLGALKVYLQGLDVVHAVSRAAVGVATTLDTAIEQLMEGWVSPLDRNRRRRPMPAASDSKSGAVAEGSELPARERHGASSVSRDHSGELVSIRLSLMP